MEDSLAALLAAGFTLREINFDQQPGLPYRGWTLPQFRLFTRIAIRSQMHMEIMMRNATLDAIGLAFASKGDRKKLQADLKKRYENA